MVYNRVRQAHVVSERLQAGGATRLGDISRIVCEGATFSLVDVHGIRMADGREYEVARLRLDTTTRWLANLRLRLGFSGYTFSRIALKPREDASLGPASLASFPSELAKVRFQYTMATPLMPLELQGPVRDVLSEHDAQTNPAAFNAVRIGREACEYYRSIQNMGGRTLPTTLK